MRDNSKTVSRIMALMFLATLAGASAGCFQLRTANVEDGLDAVSELRAEQQENQHPVQVKIDREVAVTIIAPRHLGVSPPPGRITTSLFEAIPLKKGNEMRHLKSLARERGHRTGVLVRNYGKALKRLVTYHLSRRFRNVSVRLVRQSPKSASTAVVAQRLLVTCGRRHWTVVELTVWPRGGKPITVNGQAMKPISWEHLAWGIPLSLTGVGSAVFLVVMKSLHRTATEESIALAMDAAAAKLAERIAEDALTNSKVSSRAAKARPAL